KSIAYARSDGSYASEVYIIPSAGGEAHNVTRYATYNGDVTWSKNGQKLAFVSQRRGGMAMHVLSLQKPSVSASGLTTLLSGGPDIDGDDIHLRVPRPAPNTADEGAISPDGNRVAFRSADPAGGDDLWVANSDGRQIHRVTTGGQRPRQIRWSNRLP